MHRDVSRPSVSRTLRAALILFLLLATTSAGLVNAQQQAFAREEFKQVWQRVDGPVADGRATRSWLWGPEPRTPGMQERYLDSPGNERTVQYFDKGRMEINQPDADPSDPWFVTSGLLTRELISGKIQIGDDAYLDTGRGADLHVAGDPMIAFPQYRHLEDVVDHSQPDRTGERAGQTLTQRGLVEDASNPDDPKAEFVHYQRYRGPDGTIVGYNVPRAFWEYIHESGIVYDGNGEPVTVDPLFSWIYFLGYPISDPFWVEVPVNGEERWILVQPFERRVLTYTPQNPEGWRVEMGNIGQHYRDWRARYLTAPDSTGNPTTYALSPGQRWRYGTSTGVDEIWEMTETSESFISGTTTFARAEYSQSGQRTTYWSMNEDGLFLHGWDTSTRSGSVDSMVVYSPALHVLPRPFEEATLTTNTTILSMDREPVSATFTVDVPHQQWVSTPAGLFHTWRVEPSPIDDPELDHGLGDRFWFAPEGGVIQWIDGDFHAHLTRSTGVDEPSE